MTCKYPTCSEKTGLNKWGMCKKHEGKYSAYKSKLGGRSFNLQYIQEGLKRMSEKAPRIIKPAFPSKATERLEEVKQELF